MPSPESHFRLRPYWNRTSISPGLLPVTWLLACGSAAALDRTWIGGNIDWVDGGSTANWSPADEPDADDTAVFNTANTVSLGSNNSINGLTLSGGIDLLTSDFDLTVDGLVQLSGVSTNLVVGGSASLLNADNVTINASGTVELAGGSLILDEEAGSSVLDVNAGGSLVGNGTVTFADVPLGITTQWVNDGTLTALSRSLLIFGSPPVGTLVLNDSSTTARIDLDGAGEAGVVNVNRNQTLDLNIPLADSFNGALNLFHNTTFDSSAAWTMAGGTLNVKNGFEAGVFPSPNIAASTSVIAGGTFTLSGGILTVIDTDGTLRFDNGFNLTGGTLSNAGKILFNGTTSITNAPSFAPANSTSSIEISGAMTVGHAAGNFNWDGPGTASTTVLGTGSLSITANMVDTTDNVYGGTLNLNDEADLTVNVAGTEWTLASTLNKNNAGNSTVSGDRIVLTGTVNVAAGALTLPAVTTTSSSLISVSGTLTLGGASQLGGVLSLAGSGLLRMEGTSTVTANTTIATTTFDWDGIGTGSAHTINDGVAFTINSPVLDSDGDMDDPVNLGGNGASLIVNGPAQWTQTGVFHANNAAAGTATIGGSAAVTFTNTLNINGNTNITAPVTFSGPAFFADIDAGKILNLASSATYTQGLIDGAGTFDPAASNVVTSEFTINADIFDFDGGSWTIESGAKLTVNTIDYDTSSNSFDTVITMQSGAVTFFSGDAEFVMNGTLNLNNVGGGAPSWAGQPIDIGNDSGSLDAHLNVSGTGLSDFSAPVDFNSDADVHIAAGTSLRFLTGSTVNFDTVNGPNNAGFTGPGSIAFNGTVNVNEAVTLNLAGGSVDLDGTDGTGEFINIDAPLTIHAATLASFGRNNGGGGVNTLDINESAGTGVLNVILDNVDSEWTLNGPGVINLVNDNTEATLLSGNPLNLNGTLNVTGDVRTTARLDIAGTVNINTAGQPLRLAGGGNGISANTIQGATIGGAGLLGADTGKSLTGFGTINAGIDFDGSATLLADDGILVINQPIVDAGQVGTADADGTLNVVSAWNNNVTTGVQLNGGVLSGGVLTNDIPAGISGRGLVSSRVINNTQLLASLGDPLVFQTAGNDNDWDGTTNTGRIKADLADIELRDNATFGFTGTVSASNGHTAFSNGFALDFNPGSSIVLNNGTYRSTSTTDIGGTVTVNGAAPSTLQVTNNSFLTFQSTSVVTLNQNLVVSNNNINIDVGATFSGAGALVIPPAGHIVIDSGATVNVLLDLQGTLRPAGFDTVGRVDVKDYQQASTGKLFAEITGTSLNQYDRVVVNGSAVIDGYVNLDIDGGFIPVAGQTFNILSASGGVTGTFNAIDSSGLPPGLVFKLNYLPTVVQVEVIAGGEYEQWISLFPSLSTPASRMKTADPDGDGWNNLAEFALDGDPTSGASQGKVVGKIAPVAGVNAWTLTFPVHYGPFGAVDPPGGELVLRGAGNPDILYTIQASDDLLTYPLDVEQVSGADATAIQAGLPPLHSGWLYATCRSPGPVAGDPAEFMRLGITEGTP